MFKRIGKQSKDSVGIALDRLAGSAWRGVGALFGFVAGLEKEGKDKYVELGEITGRTKSGKEIKGRYGFRVKVGLNPEEFGGQKRLNNGSGGSE